MGNSAQQGEPRWGAPNPEIVGGGMTGVWVEPPAASRSRAAGTGVARGALDARAPRPWG